MNIMNIFTDHPRSIGESYWEHMRFAIRTVFRLKVLEIALFTHAFFPFLFTDTMSRGVDEIAEEIKLRSQKRK